MKTKSCLLLATLLTISLSLILSCDNSTGPDNNHSFPTAIDSVASDITLYVLGSPSVFKVGKKSSLTETNAPFPEIVAIDTLELNTEGSIIIDYENTDSYFIYATADGFYTEIYYCSKGESIDVDLDAVPDVPNSITGVIFENPGFPPDRYHEELDIVITDVSGHSIFGTTDSLGRYGFSNLSACTYVMLSEGFGIPPNFTIENTTGTDYTDLYSMSEIIVYAPNIYLYPEITSDINLNIDFPNGGRIVESQPPYNNGWNVKVTPEGIIDGQYGYLFYETSQPISLNYLSGWLLDGGDLENEIRHLLMNLGYAGREIDDFIDYWLPRFENPNYLAVYPQDVESMITLTINPVPDNLLRMIFFFRLLDEPIELDELPLPDAIQRDGFTAVEWGGILLKE